MLNFKSTKINEEVPYYTQILRWRDMDMDPSIRPSHNNDHIPKFKPRKKNTYIASLPSKKLVFPLNPKSWDNGQPVKILMT